MCLQINFEMILTKSILKINCTILKKKDTIFTKELSPDSSNQIHICCKFIKLHICCTPSPSLSFTIFSPTKQFERSEEYDVHPLKVAKTLRKWSELFVVIDFVIFSFGSQQLNNSLAVLMKKYLVVTLRTIHHFQKLTATMWLSVL